MGRCRLLMADPVMAPRARVVFSLMVLERVTRRAKKALNFLGVMEGMPLLRGGGDWGGSSEAGAVSAAEELHGVPCRGDSSIARSSSPAMTSDASRGEEVSLTEGSVPVVGAVDVSRGWRRREPK